MKTLTEALIEVSNQTNNKVTYKELAAVLGYTKQYVSQIKNETLTPEQCNKIENHYKISLTKSSKDSPDDLINLDYFPDVCGSCGNGVFEFSTQKELLAVPKNVFYAKFSPKKEYFIINAYGNSMEPLIHDKDLLVIEPWNGAQIIDNKPYLFCYHDEIFIKKLVKNINQLLIIPVNQEYETIKLTGNEMSDVDIIGKVAGLLLRNFE